MRRSARSVRASPCPFRLLALLRLTQASPSPRRKVALGLCGHLRRGSKHPPAALRRGSKAKTSKLCLRSLVPATRLLRISWSLAVAGAGFWAGDCTEEAAWLGVPARSQPAFVCEKTAGGSPKEAEPRMTGPRSLGPARDLPTLSYL